MKLILKNLALTLFLWAPMAAWAAPVHVVNASSRPWLLVVEEGWGDMTICSTRPDGTILETRRTSNKQGVLCPTLVSMAPACAVSLEFDGGAKGDYAYVKMVDWHNRAYLLSEPKHGEAPQSAGLMLYHAPDSLETMLLPQPGPGASPCHMADPARTVALIQQDSWPGYRTLVPTEPNLGGAKGSPELLEWDLLRAGVLASYREEFKATPGKQQGSRTGSIWELTPESREFTESMINPEDYF